MSDIPPLLDEDFQSIVLHLSFFNITTKTEVTEGKRYLGDQVQKNNDDAKINLVEFRDNGLVIEVPARSGAEGHQLRVNVITEGAKENLNINFVVTVTQVEKMAPLRDQFVLEFNEYNSKEWRQLQDIISSRQNEIEEFLKAARGY